MQRLWIILICGCALDVAGCQSGNPRSDELPGPPITLYQVVPSGTGHFKRARGEIELYLTHYDPAYTFWNDPETKLDAWGTITLKTVEEDGTVVVDFLDEEMRARPGKTFPRTGVKVIASNPRIKTALLRTRFTHTIIEESPARYRRKASP